MKFFQTRADSRSKRIFDQQLSLAKSQNNRLDKLEKLCESFRARLAKIEKMLSGSKAEDILLNRDDVFDERQAVKQKTVDYLHKRPSKSF